MFALGFIQDSNRYVQKLECCDQCWARRAAPFPIPRNNRPSVECGTQARLANFLLLTLDIALLLFVQ